MLAATCGYQTYLTECLLRQAVPTLYVTTSSVRLKSKRQRRIQRARSGHGIREMVQQTLSRYPSRMQGIMIAHLKVKILDAVVRKRQSGV